MHENPFGISAAIGDEPGYLSVQSFWIFVTDFGDSAVTIPLAAFVLFFLLLARDWPTTRAWVIMVLGCAVVIGILKLVLASCAQRLVPGGIVSPSGHTAMSIGIYLSFGWLLGRGTAKTIAIAIYVGAVAIGIGISRVILHVHDVAEVLVGSIVGVAGHACFLWMQTAKRLTPLPIIMMAVAAVVLIAARHGTRWDVEPRLDNFARWLNF
jgi:membrane-associated phospholipid phosphatase